MNYEQFLLQKQLIHTPTGIANIKEMPKILFDFQKHVVRRGLALGRFCIWGDCGTGKGLMQVSWAQQIPGRVLIVAPLTVADDTIAEGKRIGLPIVFCRSEEQARKQRVSITNFEMLHAFTFKNYNGIVLDESSILKAFDGKTRNQIIEGSSIIPFRLACTATPSPNDYMEIGNHAEFVGALSYSEMLSTFFVHDGGETQKWRLKKHAEKDFWKWVCSWAVMFRTPSDLGFDNKDFVLPPLENIVHQVKTEITSPNGFESLLPYVASTLPERIRVRRESIKDRCNYAAELVNSNTEPWAIWCNLNAEGDLLEKLIPDAVQIKGGQSIDHKRELLIGFKTGKHRAMVSKSSMTGYGVNWQHCRNVLFVGLNDSREEAYQALRRCWRYPQKKKVFSHYVISQAEGASLTNQKRKEKQAEEMLEKMVVYMNEASKSQVIKTGRVIQKERGKNWISYLGDSIEVCRQKIPNETIDFSIFSPPFAMLYVYSANNQDIGNSRSHEEFFRHFKFLITELYRITKPGRLCAIYCMNLPTSKARDGLIGLTDFRGRIIQEFSVLNWIYHSEVCIWKDPVTAMQRTKALGLLHKTIRKDSSMARQGIADYVVVMRKPGDNTIPIPHTHDTFPVNLWQKWASPVWDDINPSDTLQFRSAREHDDERHICPLQLEVARRSILLWSNPGDIVCSPFSGIASEGYEALRCGRRFIGMELKRSYWEQGTRNLKAMEESKNTRTLLPIDAAGKLILPAKPLI
jgi:hypothetical protein